MQRTVGSIERGIRASEPRGPFAGAIPQGKLDEHPRAQTRKPARARTAHGDRRRDCRRSQGRRHGEGRLQLQAEKKELENQQERGSAELRATVESHIVTVGSVSFGNLGSGTKEGGHSCSRKARSPWPRHLILRPGYYGRQGRFRGYFEDELVVNVGSPSGSFGCIAPQLFLEKCEVALIEKNIPGCHQVSKK
jgi:hypothetical protein